MCNWKGVHGEYLVVWSCGGTNQPWPGGMRWLGPGCQSALLGDRSRPESIPTEETQGGRPCGPAGSCSVSKCAYSSRWCRDRQPEPPPEVGGGVEAESGVSIWGFHLPHIVDIFHSFMPFGSVMIPFLDMKLPFTPCNFKLYSKLALRVQ